MRINVAVPEEHVSKPILDAALEATTRVNESLIRSGVVPRFSDAVKAGVRWKPEAPGAEYFDHALTVMNRKAGDCDDLGPWRAAELRVTGEDPGARSVVKSSGRKKWHAYVERSNAPDEDPSVQAGMLSYRPVHGAILPNLGVHGLHGVGAAVTFPRIAVRPVFDPRSDRIESWQARADLPWHYDTREDSPVNIAMASLHASPDASQAIAGACQGAAVIGGFQSDIIEPAAIDFLEAMAMASEGAEWEDVADEWGPDMADEVASTVSGLFKAIKKGLAPARKVLNSKQARFVAPLVNPGGYALARGLDASMSREGNIVQKAKGFGGGYARGYQDRFANPVFKGVAQQFGMKGIAKGLENASDFAAQGFEKGGNFGHFAQAFQHGGGALADSYGAKLPSLEAYGVRVPPIAEMAPPGAGASLYLPACAVAAREY